MVKIEAIQRGATATIERNKERTQLFTGQLIHAYDIDTIKVDGGNIIISIDEVELVKIGEDGSKVNISSADFHADEVVTSNVVVAAPVAAPAAAKSAKNG